MARGRHIQARYRPTPIPQFNGNPCIETLWDEFDLVTVATTLRSEPSPMPKHIRSSSVTTKWTWLAATLSELYVPSRTSLQVAERLYNATILSYQFRNPLSLQGGSPNTLVNGFNLPGVSGVGKTTTMVKSLQLMPQRVSHREYQGRRWTREQLVWIHLEVPAKGSPKTFCHEFFEETDKILETNYAKLYGHDTRASLDRMIAGMKRVIENHCIGLIFVDEVNHWVMRKDNDAQALLNFLFSLKNKLGVSVVALGDYSALPLFMKQMRLMGRASGQGDLIWDRMIHDGPTWHALLSALFKYQVVQRPVDLDQEISQALYYGSQGILRFTLQIFLHVQRFALERKLDRITPAMIYQVIEKDVVFSRGVLRALRTGDRRLLAQEYPDVYPTQLTEYLVDAMKRGDIEGCLQLLPDLQVAARKVSQQDHVLSSRKSAAPTTAQDKRERNSGRRTTDSSSASNETEFSGIARSMLRDLEGLTQDHKGRYQAYEVYERLRGMGSIIDLETLVSDSQ